MILFISFSISIFCLRQKSNEAIFKIKRHTWQGNYIFSQQLTLTIFLTLIFCPHKTLQCCKKYFCFYKSLGCDGDWRRSLCFAHRWLRATSTTRYRVLPCKIHSMIILPFPFLMRKRYFLGKKQHLKCISALFRFVVFANLCLYTYVVIDIIEGMLYVTASYSQHNVWENVAK